MSRAGLPGPAYALAASWPEACAAATAIGFPLVAKPIDLNSGTSVRRVDDEAALKDAFWDVVSVERNSRGQPLRRVLLLEELLAGPEVSVEAVTRAGVTTIIGITSKLVTGAPAFVEAGHEFPARLDPEVARQVEDLTRSTLEAVGYTHGLSHTELRLTADGPRLVELNPRQAGGHIFDLVRMVTGTHPLEVLVDLALGRTPRLGAVDAPLTVADAAPVASAAVSFVMSPASGRLRAVEGVERLAADPAVWRWEIDAVGPVERPGDNNARLGHVLAADEHGHEALAKAQAAVSQLRLRMDDGSVLAPLLP
jgi:biotin carboxylase